MTEASASASAGVEASSSRSSSAPKLTCLCSPTNHPGSFRCSRHRSPRGRIPSSLSSGRASLAGAGVPGRGEGVRSGGGGGGGGGTGRAKGRSVLRAHLLRMISPPSSGRDQRPRLDFQPRPSRLGQFVDT